MVTRCLYAFAITAAIISSVSCTPGNQPYDEPLLYPVAQYVDSLGGIQEAPLDLRWLFRVSTKWGYIDTAGNQIIPPIFDYASYFREGRAMIRKDGRFGFIDESGGVVIDPIYSRATLFSEGLSAVTYPDSSIIFIDKDNIPIAVVSLDGKLYGAINIKGEWVVPPVYSKLGRFRGPLAAIQDPETGTVSFVNRRGDPITNDAFAGCLEFPNPYRHFPNTFY